MTCNKCGEKPKKGCGAFPKAVIEIDNPEKIVLLRKVMVPASMGDESTFPPTVGKYKNVLLFYEANSKSYLYSSDGIPTLLANGITDYEQAVNLPQINGNTLIGNKTGTQLGLQDKLTAGDNITIENNVISATDTTYGPATDAEIGLVKPGDGLEVDASGTMSISDIEQYAHFFDTVADMKAATNLVAGDYARTYGYYSVNDGGKALYIITDTEPSSHYETLQGGLYAQLITNGVIHTKQIGIVGDGTTDETTKLQEFFASDNHTYIVDNGTILIDGDISISSNSDVIFNNEAVIKRKTTSSNSYFMFNIINKHDITIKNAHLMGDRDTHTGVDGEWGHGINICYSYNILVEDTIIEKTWGDGIYIGASFVENKSNDVSNVVCRNCVVDSCSRNGYSVCQGNTIKLINCRASHCDRIAPKAGIDIEPEQPDGTTGYLRNVEIIGFNSDNNDYGIQVHTTQAISSNIVIDGHNSLDDKYGISFNNRNYTTDIVYRNAVISKFKTTGINIITVSDTYNSHVTISNVTFNSTYSATNNAIWLLGDTSLTTANVDIDGITVTNTYENMYEPDFIFNAYWYENEVRSFKNINIKNYSDNLTTNDKRRFNVYKSVSGINFINCNIPRTVSGTYYLGNTFINNIKCNPVTTNTLVINTTLLDGDYKFSFNGNNNATDHIIQFPASVVVYSGSTQIHNGSGNKYYHITANCCDIEFTKENGVINITKHNGIDTL